MEQRIVREAERRVLTGVPRVSWYRLELAGQAPVGRQLTPNTKGWLLSEIQEWIENRQPIASASDAG